MKKITILLLNIMFITNYYAQSITENYIQTRNYLEPVTTSNNSTAKQTQIVQYFDGLGRSKQIVGVKVSPSENDVVYNIEYNQYGLQTKEYLPIPQAGTQNGNIYSSPLGNTNSIYGSEKIYSENVLQVSPISRIQQKIQVGNDWSVKPVNYDYDINMSGDYVKKYETSLVWDAINKIFISSIQSVQYYQPAQLFKTSVKDEDGNETITFRNKSNQVILVRKVINSTENADTYYVYNMFEQLAYVIPPLASVYSTLSSTVLNDLCYQYYYDVKNRLIEKKLPGKGWEFMVYDKQDRLVLTQDANLRAQGQWLYTKYDSFGRVALTGISDGSSRVTEQTNTDAKGSNNEYRGELYWTNSGMSIYYTNQHGYPNANIYKVLSINYYDTYPSDTPPIPTQILGQNVLPQDAQNSNISTKSLPVASYVKNIEDDNWTKNYTWYDTKGRVIGSHSINHLGGYTKTESELDFAGVTKQAITRHKRLHTDTEKVITETFTYDHQNRLKVHKHKIDNNPEEILAQNDYNELSQLRSKFVGGASLGSGLQTVDYTYNIRGWMTKINDPANLGVSDLFGYKIKYNEVEGLETPNLDFADLKVKPKYNGNIAEVDWKTATTPSDNLRRYGYVYDGLNRLLAGFYQKDNNPSAKEYYEKMTYDLNGNIINLKRSEAILTGSATAMNVDDLDYVYTGNTLQTVTDQSHHYSGYPDTSGNPISYDLNRNMTTHKDKGILEISYDILNLPGKITFYEGLALRSGIIRNNTTHTYRADGVKLKKIYKYAPYNPLGTVTELSTEITDYLDGFQYKTKSVASGGPRGGSTLVTALEFYPTPEGYFDYIKNKYIYNYTDHLGNVRLSYLHNGSSIEVLEENNYYPFGLKHEGYNPLAGSPSYQYKYNGKELQETGMYDYGARFYMPDIGRWGVVDPLAEKMTRHSPYNYAFNNPIRFIDPDGREGEDWFKNSFGDMEFRNDIHSQKDMIDKGVQGKYVGETAQVGNLTYAADGYVYDDDGKVIADGRSHEIQGVTMTKANWWNSPLARFLVPDRFGVTSGATFGGGAEAGLSMGLEVITRGKDAGIYFDPGNNLSLGVAAGAGGETDLSFFSSTFTGDVSDMTLNSVVGTEAYVNGSATYVAGVVGKVAISFDPNPNNGPVSGRWITRSVGVAAGAKGSVGAGVTLSNTRVGVGFDGKARVADYTGAITGKGSY